MQWTCCCIDEAFRVGREYEWERIREGQGDKKREKEDKKGG